MNSYLWELSREYLDSSTPQRKTEALAEIKKKIKYPSQIQDQNIMFLNPHSIIKCAKPFLLVKNWESYTQTYVRI